MYYYIDIIKSCDILGDETSYLDLILDIVTLPDGSVIELDFDELVYSYKMGFISKDDYELAIKSKNHVLNVIVNDRNYLYNICNKFYNILRNNIF